MIKIPNLIIVGAAKSGTTTLFNELRSHPKIFIPEIKECRYFSQMSRNSKGGDAAAFQNEGPRSLNSYLELFSESNEEHILDISNDYFYFYEKTIKNIIATYKELNLPQPKILIILRNPIERVFSMYHHTIRLNSDYLSFDEAFEASSIRIRNNYAWVFDLKGIGMSFKACEAYLENFKEVKIALFDELKDGNLIGEILDFMGLDKNSIKKENVIYNKNSYAKPRFLKFKWLISKLKNFLLQRKILVKNKNNIFFKILVKFYFFLISNKSKTKSNLTTSQINKLTNYYKEDITNLSSLIGINLKHWILE